MAEEHVTTDPQTHTTIITERRGGGAGWVIAIVLVIALVAGIMIFSRTTDSQAAKDNAIANAAGQVGDAAQKVGTAAEDAAKQLDK